MEKWSRTRTLLYKWWNSNTSLFLSSLATGLVSGLVVILFRFLIEKVEGLRLNLYRFIQAGNPWFIVPLFPGLILIALLLGKIVQKEPMAGGSGIPQVKGVVLFQVKMQWLKVLTAKFAGGVLALAAGLSVGREGPSIQLGANIGQGIRALLKREKFKEQYLITAGASAGLAAAFNAPLAGVMFALEELHKHLSPYVLMASVTASLAADFISKNFFGQKPIFDFQHLAVLPQKYYYYLIILGVLLGVFGAIFNWSLISTIKVYGRIKLPKYLLPVLPVLLSGVLGFLLPEVLGGGHGLIEQLARGWFPLELLAILFLVKFLFTMVSYGSGVPGGIFLPLLCIGALFGKIFGIMAVNTGHLDPQLTITFIALAMSAFFTAIVKAPITGSILITEMTGSFNHLLPLMVVSMTAFLVSNALKSKPIYDILLVRMLKSHGAGESSQEQKNKMIMEIPVGIGSQIAGKQVDAVAWPDDILLVGIKRGDMEILPRGKTVINANDCLIVLTDEAAAGKVQRKLLHLAEEKKE